MPPTTRFEFGDIVLVPFPFTDITTIEQSLVIRQLGRLKQDDQTAVRKTFTKIVG